MRWARHMARLAERTDEYRVLVGKPEEKRHLENLGVDGSLVLVGKPEEKRHLEDLGVDGSLVLKWIFEKWVEDMDWIDLA